MTDTDNCY